MEQRIQADDFKSLTGERPRLMSLFNRFRNQILKLASNKWEAPPS